jgi:hypothetical protein
VCRLLCVRVPMALPVATELCLTCAAFQSLTSISTMFSTCTPMTALNEPPTMRVPQGLLPC